MANASASMCGFQGKQHHLGYFDNLENAKEARQQAEEKLFGTFSKQWEKGK